MPLHRLHRPQRSHRPPPHARDGRQTQLPLRHRPNAPQRQDAHFRSFEQQVLPKLVEQGIGVLGMKSMGSGVILKSTVVKPVECLHYALNLPTSVVITGIDSMKILDQAIEAAKTFKPLSNDQVAALLARTADAAKEGKFELFKTTMKSDSTAQHPQWLGEQTS